MKENTLDALVTLNTISLLAASLAPAARKQVQAVIEASFKEVKLPADYTLHFVEKQINQSAARREQHWAMSF